MIATLAIAHYYQKYSHKWLMRNNKELLDKLRKERDYLYKINNQNEKDIEKREKLKQKIVEKENVSNNILDKYKILDNKIQQDDKKRKELYERINASEEKIFYQDEAINILMRQEPSYYSLKSAPAFFNLNPKANINPKIKILITKFVSKYLINLTYTRIINEDDLNQLLVFLKALERKKDFSLEDLENEKYKIFIGEPSETAIKTAQMEYCIVITQIVFKDFEERYKEANENA